MDLVRAVCGSTHPRRRVACVLGTSHTGVHTSATGITWEREGKHKRGASNSNDRGNAAQRRARKCWALAWFGDGISCLCFRCGRVLLYSTLELDKIIPGAYGGTYARGNVRPACGECNREMGHALRALIRARTPKRTILRMCRNGEL